MKHQHLQDLISQAFVSAHPARAMGATGLLILGLALCGAIMTVEIKNNSADNAVEQGPENKNLVSTILLVLIVLAACTSGSALMLRKSVEYDAAQYVIKRKLRDMARKYPELKNIDDDKLLKDIADLIVSRMTEQEITSICVCARDFAIMSEDAKALGSENLVKIIKIENLKYLQKILNTVIARNPGLDETIYQIATGKTLYSPKTFGREKR